MTDTVVEHVVTVLTSEFGVKPATPHAVSGRKQYQENVKLGRRLDGILERLERLRTIIVRQHDTLRCVRSFVDVVLFSRFRRYTTSEQRTD